MFIINIFIIHYLFDNYLSFTIYNYISYIFFFLMVLFTIFYLFFCEIENIFRVMYIYIRIWMSEKRFITLLSLKQQQERSLRLVINFNSTTRLEKYFLWSSNNYESGSFSRLLLEMHISIDSTWICYLFICIFFFSHLQLQLKLLQIAVI